MAFSVAAELIVAGLARPAIACPHCGTHFAAQLMHNQIVDDVDGRWFVEHQSCTSCGRAVLWLSVDDGQRRLIRPFGAVRPLPADVDASFAAEFAEAGAVLAVSAKASAALSRRLLQRILHELAGVTAPNLSREIEVVIDANTLPADLAEDLDAVRVTGNFAAHPIKSTSTGEIVEVELGEAEWLLDVLEELLDFYFVRPARRARRREAFDAKLQAAGKPPLKSQPPDPSD